MSANTDITTDQRIRSVTCLLHILRAQVVASRYTEISETSSKLEHLLNHLALLFVIEHPGQVVATAVKIGPGGVRLFDASTAVESVNSHLNRNPVNAAELTS